MAASLEELNEERRLIQVMSFFNRVDWNAVFADVFRKPVRIVDDVPVIESQLMCDCLENKRAELESYEAELKAAYTESISVAKGEAQGFVSGLTVKAPPPFVPTCKEPCLEVRNLFARHARLEQALGRSFPFDLALLLRGQHGR